MMIYRRDMTRKGWHRSWPLRVALMVVGLALFVAGGVGWSLEQEYGGDPDRSEYVIGDEGDRVVVYGERGAVVYEATDIPAAEAYVDSRRGARNFTVPSLLFVGAVLLTILGVAPHR